MTGEELARSLQREANKRGFTSYDLIAENGPRDLMDQVTHEAREVIESWWDDDDDREREKRNRSTQCPT